MMSNFLVCVHVDVDNEDITMERFVFQLDLYSFIVEHIWLNRSRTFSCKKPQIT